MLQTAPLLALGLVAPGCSAGEDNVCDTLCPPSTFSTSAATETGDGSPTVGPVVDNDDDDGASSTSGAVDTGPPLECAWWDRAWGQRSRISLWGAPAGLMLERVPILLRLTPQRIAYDAASDFGHDIRIVAADDTTVLPHEIERWNGSGESIVWLSLPQVTGPETEFFIYYNNPDGLGAENAAAVWDNDYLLVAHLAEELTESTSLSPLTNAGAVPTPGFVGSGHNFDGDDEIHISAGNPVHLNNVFTGGATLSVWINARSYGGGGWGRIIDKSTAPIAGSGYFVCTSHDNFDNYRSLETWWHYETGKNRWQTPQDSMPLGDWQWVVFQFDDTVPGTAPTVTVDGSPQPADPQTDFGGRPRDDSEGPLWIGASNGRVNREFDGVMDEFRLAKGIRSPEWLELQRASMLDTLLTYGPIEPLPAECQ